MAKKLPDFPEDKNPRIRKRQILFGSFLLILGFLMTVSFISFLFHHQSDQSTLEVFFEKEVQSQNLLNKIGALGSHFFVYQLFGFLYLPLYMHEIFPLALLPFLSLPIGGVIPKVKKLLSKIVNLII